MIMKYSISSVAPMTLLIPVFGMLGGYWFYDEVVLFNQVIAAGLILLGLFIGQMNANLSLSQATYRSSSSDRPPACNQ